MLTSSYVFILSLSYPHAGQDE